MELVGLHPGLGEERDLKHSDNVLPVLTALLMSVLHYGNSYSYMDLGKNSELLISVDIYQP